DLGVSAGHPLAVDAGAQILDSGGTAADAIVAAAFAVAVVEPFASGIGGDGSAIVAGPEMDPVAYDYREEVPAHGSVPPSGAGVPGFVAGLAELHSDYGELDWAEVIAPAIELAGSGFTVTEFLELRLRSDRGPEAILGQEQFSPGGATVAAGDTLVQEDLASTMTAIAEDGPEAFYTGALVDELTAVDGLDAESLADYEVVRAAPVSGSFGDYELLGPPPALAGAALVQMLQVAEAAGAGQSAPGSAAYIEQFSQGWAQAEETAHTELGDPAFVDVPIAEITDSEANASLATGDGAGTNAAGALVSGVGPPGAPALGGPDRGPEHAGNTTHLTVTDAEGMMISMTNTITSFWGSQESVGGYFVNDQLTRFDAVGSTDANVAEAGRRSVSWSLPVVVLDDQERPVLGLGSPGGERIPVLLGNVLTRWALHSQSLDEAIEATRFAFADGQVLLEEEPTGEVAADLSLSYEVIPAEWAYFGSVQALEVDYEVGTVIGAVDTRREADLVIGTVDE
ncbi:MAG TPA: gamma-glutamyltransferase, partial [Beutenbergiaceae bacterium]|nr:gamma-glutamyltransferase [Beutenbergiaceae bacterium]